MWRGKLSPGDHTAQEARSIEAAFHVCRTAKIPPVITPPAGPAIPRRRLQTVSQRLVHNRSLSVNVPKQAILFIIRSGGEVEDIRSPEVVVVDQVLAEGPPVASEA